MVFNDRRTKRKKTNSLTWALNQSVHGRQNVVWTANFESNKKKFKQIRFTYEDSYLDFGDDGQWVSDIYIYYDDTLAHGDRAYDGNGSEFKGNDTIRTSEEYETLTFEQEPTGDLLAWLQANATPQ